MSKTTRIAVLAAAALVVAGSQADAAQNDPTIRDIIPQVQDITVVVSSLDNSLTDADSTKSEELRLSADIAFDFDKSDLRSNATQTLEEIAGRIKANAKGVVRVDGYTDSVGDNAYNQALSQRRAQAVADRLKSLVDANAYQLAVAGHGSADPIAPNKNQDGSDNPDGRALNRRVVISFGK
jgi:outer membrane protein OmpA-like peptidoglycan-associated protein